MNTSQRFAFRGPAAIVMFAVSSWFISPVAAEEGQGPELRAPVVERPAVDASFDPASFELPSPVPRPEERDAAFAAGIDEVRRSGILEAALRVGDKAVDFELPEAGGRNLRLSELWAVGPVVLVYYRGGWCPFCSRHLQSTAEGALGYSRAGCTARGSESGNTAARSDNRNRQQADLSRAE